MAIHKKDQFSELDIALAEMMKALAHPARIEILRILAEKNTCICGEIVEVLPLSQSTVSQHLKELKNVGLIKGEIEGVKSCYCINWEKFKYLQNLFASFSTDVSKCNCC